MGLQKHSKVLNETVEMLSDEGSYQQLFHAYRDEEALPSGEVLKEIIDLCRAILFPGYYGNARISKQTIRFHTGVNVGTLHTLLSRQIMQDSVLLILPVSPVPKKRSLPRRRNCRKPLSGCFPKCAACWQRMLKPLSTEIPLRRTSTRLFFVIPVSGLSATIALRTSYTGWASPFLPCMITEMAHSETGIDIHPGAEIGHYFSIDHGTGTVIGETSVIGNHVRIFQGVSLAGEKLPPDENGNAIRGVPRHPVLGDHVTVYSNATLLGRIHVGEGATICGNVWITEDVPAGATVSQLTMDN